ncbi:MAG: hypothetical protein AB1426_10110 [Bacillota bacterium]
MADQERFAEEGEWYDLTPPEKQLIGWSLGLGVALLGILVWISYTLIPVPH